ncbi:MAG: hypothetical protein ACR2HX_24145 [Pyrinomonadaceae bacterium]
MRKQSVLPLAFFVAITVSFSCPASLFGQTAPKSTQQAAWDLGDTLSLAAVDHGEDVAPATVNSLFVKAKGNAKQLNMTLPDLPVKTGDKIKNKASALQYMLNIAGKPIGATLTTNYNLEHALLFELSLKSNVLLMMYGPGESTTQAIANVIKTRSERLSLPPKLTANLLRLIEAGADYSEVKAAIFQMHKDVANYLRPAR